MQSIRSKMEKELINCTHLKEQLAKELREKDILCESKSEELLTIGKALERAVSDQRSKTNELNSEYM